MERRFPMERPDEGTQQDVGPKAGERIDPGTGEPLREEDVTRADRLDDRVEEGDGLEDGDA
jgi:hypothetical protein